MSVSAVDLDHIIKSLVEVSLISCLSPVLCIQQYLPQGSLGGGGLQRIFLRYPVVINYAEIASTFTESKLLPWDWPQRKMHYELSEGVAISFSKFLETYCICLMLLHSPPDMLHS